MKIISFAFCLLLMQCGFADAVTDPKVIVYNADTPAPGGESSECDQIFLRSYQKLFKEAVDASCGTANCHGGGAGGQTLTIGADEANFKVLMAYSDTAAENELLEKLNGTTSHSGGKQTGQNNLEDADIQAWDIVESNCE